VTQRAGRSGCRPFTSRLASHVNGYLGGPMRPKKVLKNILVKLDQYSPHPIFYAFIMTRKEKCVFDEAIGNAGHYLEFGMGGSTLRAIQKSKAIIYTVESSPEWISHMRGYVVIKSMEKKRLHIFFVNIGPVQNWGYPATDRFKDDFEAYSSKVFRLIDKKLLDVVLIDGRFRVACALKTIIECHGNAKIKIMIHDFWERPHYHVLIKYLDVVKREDSLGLFSIKHEIDLNAVEEDYQSYKSMPE
jgi:hypothetical protein